MVVGLGAGQAQLYSFLSILCTPLLLYHTIQYNTSRHDSMDICYEAVMAYHVENQNPGSSFYSLDDCTPE